MAANRDPNREHHRSTFPFFEIQAILLHEWDPLSVGDNPHLAGEYDSYIPSLRRLLENAPTMEALADLLVRAEIDLLGMEWPANERGATSEQRVRAARALMALAPAKP